MSNIPGLLRGTSVGDAWQHVAGNRRPHGEITNTASLDSLEDGKRSTIVDVVSLDGSYDIDVSTIDPKNWSLQKKLIVTAIISSYTANVYAGSAIYIVAVESVLVEWRTSIQAALLGLSLYVLGCEYLSVLVAESLIDHLSKTALALFSGRL